MADKEQAPKDGNKPEEQTVTTQDVDPSEIASWPLWRIALKNLRELPTFGFGMRLEAKWFEHQLDEKLDSGPFGFGMMHIIGELENDPGYALLRETVHVPDSGAAQTFFYIPSEGDHIEVLGPKHNDKGYNHTRRSLNFVSKTLANPKAKLTDAQRQAADKTMQISAQRLLFMQRQNAFIKTIKAHNPKLLKGEPKDTKPKADIDKVDAPEKDKSGENPQAS